MPMQSALKNQKIISLLANAYNIDLATVSLLPIGADFNTTVYNVVATDGTHYFLKLRSGEFLEASISVPKYLADLGIKQVIPPITTNTKQLWTDLGEFKAILYPYIYGRNGVEAKLSKDQWIKFGAAIKQIHTTNIPSNIPYEIPQEMFSHKWSETVKSFLTRIEHERFDNPISTTTAEFLKSNIAEILKIIAIIEKLTFNLQKMPPQYVICHADIHGWNLIIDNQGDLYIVDWDTLILAPKERDLMFVGAGIWDSGMTPDQEKSLFYQGYGQTEIHYDALTYYRFERIIQDIGEYCTHIFLSDAKSDDKLISFEHLKSNFMPGGTIERAYDSINNILTGEN